MFLYYNDHWDQLKPKTDHIYRLGMSRSPRRRTVIQIAQTPHKFSTSLNTMNVIKHLSRGGRNQEPSLGNDNLSISNLYLTKNCSFFLKVKNNWRINWFNFVRPKNYENISGEKNLDLNQSRNQKTANLRDLSNSL